MKQKKLNCKIITTEKDYLRLNKKIFKKIKFIKSELKIIDEEKLIKFLILKMKYLKYFIQFLFVIFFFLFLKF